MKRFTRRQLLKFSALSSTGLLIAACAAPPAQAPAAPAATQAPAAAAGATKPAEQPAASTAGGGNKLEIFSWWTSGGEVGALQALYDLYKKKYPNIEIINAALAGGSGQGGNMKALLETRMIGGDPPDSFQVHLGRELIDSQVVAGRMEPLDDLYKSEGWDKVFPKGLIDLASYQGHPYSVPVNIHRSNVLWYNTKHMQEVGQEKPPETWDEWFAYAEKLKAKGIPALAVAEDTPGFSAHIFENILVATMGPDKYMGLFNGDTKWDDPDVKKSLEILNKALDYAEPNYTSVSWGDVNDQIIAGKASTMVMGDWTDGLLKSKGFKDYHWAPAPGTKGIYIALSDSFGLPKGAKDRDNIINWLKLVGSKEGQDAFNPIKGSISARSDSDPSGYDDYQKEAIQDWKTNKIVGSIQHGAAAKQSFINDYDNAINYLATKRDVDGALAKLVEAANLADFKKS